MDGSLQATKRAFVYVNKLVTAFTLLLLLAGLVGCQGLSSGKSSTAPPLLSVSPTWINFGNVTVGSKLTQTVTLTASNATVTISSAPSVPAPFSISGVSFPLSISMGKSATFSLTYAPQSSGSTSQTISLASDASNTPTAITVTGAGTTATGTTATGQLSISPSSLNFGSVAVGSTATNTAILSATGAGITISSASSLGAPFSMSGVSFPLTLATGQSASLSLTFAPQSVTTFSQNVSFTSDASNSPASISLSGAGTAATARGMFMLDPPTSDNDCAPTGLPSSCYSADLIPTFLCNGNGTPAGMNCVQAGSGNPYVKGAVFQVPWDIVQPSNTATDFSSVDNWIQPWIAAGKTVSFVFEPTSFSTTNGATPSWYLTPANIAAVSEVNGIIAVQTAAPMTFFPGGAPAAGMEIQISGTHTALDRTSAKPGIWVICDHNTSGCADPTTTAINAIGVSGGTIASVSIGTVGNPVYGSADGSVCTSGVLPVQWRPNFIAAWQALMQQAVSHYGTNPNVAYMRFGMGIGGQTNPTSGISTTDPNPTACQAQMTAYGFTSAAAPWPSPTDAAWSTVQANWEAYLKKMLQYEQSLNSPKATIITISPIEFAPDDLSTPDQTAANAAGAGIGFGNQGLNKNDPINFAAGSPCAGGDWCANFQKYAGQVPLELQTVTASDPTNANLTGSLTPLLPFAIQAGAQILELYVDDWMCTYDSSWTTDTNNNGVNTFANCTAAGYPAAFSAAAAQIN